MPSYVISRREASAQLNQTFDAKRMREWWGFKGREKAGKYSKYENKVINALRQGLTLEDAFIYADDWRAASQEKKSKKVKADKTRKSTTDAIPENPASAGLSLVDSDEPKVIEEVSIPYDDVIETGEQIVIDADKNQDGTTGTVGDIFEDPEQYARDRATEFGEKQKNRAVTGAKDAASNWLDRALGGVLGEEEDDRPPWQKYGYRGYAGFLTDVEGGDNTPDALDARSRRILLTGYIDPNETRYFVGNRLWSKKYQDWSKKGTSDVLHDARVEAIKRGWITQDQITDPHYEDGPVRSPGYMKAAGTDKAGNNEPGDPVGDGAIDGILDGIVDDSQKMIDDMYEDITGPGKDDGAPGGGIPRSDNVGGTVEPTPRGDPGVTSASIAMIALGALAIVLLLNR